MGSLVTWTHWDSSNEIPEYKFYDKTKKCSPEDFADPMLLHITFTTLWASLADNNLMVFFLIFLEKSVWYFMRIVYLGDNLHDISNPIFSVK